MGIEAVHIGQEEDKLALSSAPEVNVWWIYSFIDSVDCGRYGSKDTLVLPASSGLEGINGKDDTLPHQRRQIFPQLQVWNGFEALCAVALNIEMNPKTAVCSKCKADEKDDGPS